MNNGPLGTEGILRFRHCNVKPCTRLTISQPGPRRRTALKIKAIEHFTQWDRYETSRRRDRQVSERERERYVLAIDHVQLTSVKILVPEKPRIQDDSENETGT